MNNYSILLFKRQNRAYICTEYSTYKQLWIEKLIYTYEKLKTCIIRNFSVKLIRPYGDAPVKARNQNKKSQKKKKKNKRRKDKNKRRRRRKNRNRKNKNKKNKKNKRKKNRKKKRKGKGSK